ncbi:hypothetical protein [Zhihengliuella sp. ISTPL4]|uniref:hypothetical protein n=1 Tax=Zhihengliuella sp. ISTPL4 TaxID=2058657 RepID=UPI000C7CB7BB|nr:hypothetical protein [Zhihengliuella sp. ISTPL4]
MFTRFSTRRIRAGVLAGVGVAMLAALAACSSPSASSTAQPSESTGQAESEASSPDKAFQEWQLKFAECLRGEGIDQSDPSEDGSVDLNLGDEEAYTAAAETCEKKLGPPPAATGDTGQAVQEQQLKSAQCLRDEGYDVEDPKPGEAFGVPADASEEAIEKCLTTEGQ